VDDGLQRRLSADLSGPVMTRALCHFDNAYWLPARGHARLLRRAPTRRATPPSAASAGRRARWPSSILDSIARRLGRDPLDVRRANFYGGPAPDNVTPYGSRVEDNIIAPLVDELAAAATTRPRAEIAAFNAASPVLKKGLALTPVKFGISFNVVHFNQAGALVHVYTDGSVLVNHGGTEMGQGLNTKVAQVVAHELGMPLAACAAPPPTPEGGQHLGHRRLHRQRPQRQGRAGRRAQIRERLAAFALQRGADA
jgi:xanthine dehydrogenase large subunit